MEARTLASAERADLAEFLRTLSPADWEHPSLCEGWRVRDVVAHIVQVDEMGLLRIAGRFVKTRFDTDRFNAFGVAERADWTTERLVSTLEGQVALGRFSRIQKGAPALTDAFVHHQDIRRPLGRIRPIPADRLLAVLGHPDPFTGAKARMEGLHLAATDVDWSAGEGPDVRGPGEAIVMAVAGREVALADLEGDGVPVLRARF